MGDRGHGVVESVESIEQALNVAPSKRSRMELSSYGRSHGEGFFSHSLHCLSCELVTQVRPATRREMVPGVPINF